MHALTARRQPWNAIFTLLICFVFARAEAMGDSAETSEERPPLPQEVQEALQWYDSLGFPSVKGLSRVKVSTYWAPTAHWKNLETTKNGWLLETKPGCWRLFAEDNMGEPISPAGLRPWEERAVTERGKTKDGLRYRTGVRKIDFKTEAESMLEDLRKGRDLRQPFETAWNLSSRTKAFVTGRYCLEQGLTETGAALFHQALLTRGSGTLLRSLQENFAVRAECRLLHQFGEPKITREAILGRVEAVLKEFPENRANIKELESMAETLRAMIKEDQEHAATSKPFETMTKPEQAAEFVFHLRDQHGPYFWSTDSSPEDPSSPAARLVKMGYPAVPALMEALTSTRYTRSVALPQGGPGRQVPWVVTEGTCAKFILAKIAGREFYGSPDLNGDACLSSLRGEVEKWWKTVQKKKKH